MMSALSIALVGGAFSLVGLLVAKEQKVSEFRQAWIDALRQDIAKVVTHLELWAILTPERSSAEHLHQFRFSASAARLRLTGPAAQKGDADKNGSHREVLAVLDILEARVARHDPTVDDTRAELRRLVDATTVVLKEDWERVKKGEPRYVNALRAAVGVLVVVVILLFVTALFA
jgi:hypothetical protein